VFDIDIRFAGDSGDGMQLTGTQFTNTSPRLFGNDIATLPDFPAEIRAPPARSRRLGFQVHFSDHDILTPGDAPTCSSR
jgi:2-oxoglutarate ferredoxin oxidoreductase subunit alpha